MAKTIVNYSDPMAILDSGDALNRILNTIGISGSLLLKEEYCAPWAVSVPHSKQLNSILNLAKDIRVATFHLVERGHIQIKLDNGDNHRVEAGELVVCFSGLGHKLYQGNSPVPMPFQDILAGAENRFRPDTASKASSTSLVCGVFLLQDSLLNPLLASLPQVLKLSINNPDLFPRLSGVIKLMVQEFDYQAKGKHYVMERYLEILCAETIRAHMDNLPKQAKGWLCALKDPVIAQVMEQIHADPGYSWTVSKLADKAAISASRLAARFTAIVGESPMVYVTKWRMFTACQQLQDAHKNIEQIAGNVGYESLASFSRAFKRHTGLPPATWRKRFLKR